MLRRTPRDRSSTGAFPTSSKTSKQAREHPRPRRRAFPVAITSKCGGRSRLLSPSERDRGDPTSPFRRVRLGVSPRVRKTPFPPRRPAAQKNEKSPKAVRRGIPSQAAKQLPHYLYPNKATAEGEDSRAPQRPRSTGPTAPTAVTTYRAGLGGRASSLDGLREETRLSAACGTCNRQDPVTQALQPRKPTRQGRPAPPTGFRLPSAKKTESAASVRPAGFIEPHLRATCAPMCPALASKPHLAGDQQNRPDYYSGNIRRPLTKQETVCRERA